MTWRTIGGIVLALGLVGGLSVTPAQAVTVVHQEQGALVAPSKPRVLNDQRVHFVNVPGQYATAQNLHGVNTIASTAGAAVTFKTKYLLPIPGYKHEAWGNPQSMVTAGRYIYVIYCPTTWHNRGRIVRFDRQKLDQLKVTPRQLQRVYTTKAASSKKEAAIRKAITIGPAFTTGHGQSLAFNWKNHQLYMWQDRESAPRVPISQMGVLQHIDALTLKPDKVIRFRLKSDNLSVPGGHVLTFDKQGRAYFWTRPSASQVYIYQGKVSATHVTFRLTRQILAHGPGTRVQSMAYNPTNDRIYLVSDDSIASLPVKKLAGSGHLTSQDVKWTGFASKREFEALNFTNDGHAYLMSNHNPEILQSTGTTW